MEIDTNFKRAEVVWGWLYYSNESYELEKDFNFDHVICCLINELWDCERDDFDQMSKRYPHQLLFTSRTIKSSLFKPYDLSWLSGHSGFDDFGGSRELDCFEYDENYALYLLKKELQSSSHDRGANYCQLLVLEYD